MAPTTRRSSGRALDPATPPTRLPGRPAPARPRPSPIDRLRSLSDSALDSLMLVGALVFGATFTGLLLLLVKIVPPLVLASEAAH